MSLFDSLAADNQRPLCLSAVVPLQFGLLLQYRIVQPAQGVETYIAGRSGKWQTR